MIGQRHILVIRFSAMGDVAMTAPVIRALLDQNPNLKVTVLTTQAFVPIFNSIPGIKVYAADLQGKHKGVSGLYRLSKEIKRLNVDAIADLHQVLRTKILGVFLRSVPRFSIDKGRAEKKALVQGRIFEQLKTTHQRYADVFEKLGYSIQLDRPVFPQPARIAINKYIGNKDAVGALIGIAPFAAHQGKMYPLNLMEEVIEELSIKNEIILFGGGQEEVHALARIEKQYQNVHSVAGKMSLKEELELISNLDVMVSMDSGNGHLATIYGIKVVTIWGVTHPYAGFAPYHQPSNHSLLADKNKFPLIPTSVYGNKYPKGYEKAAGSISPKAIIEKVKDLLS
ncbi:MAG: glycosyltransferase family 9 protein [Bacteroidota bacterium]